MSGGDWAEGGPPGVGGVVEIERSGGLAGLVLAGRRLLADLSDEQRAALADCLDWFATGTEATSGAPDRFIYRLSVGEREASVAEQDLPAVLRPLLEELSPRFKP